MDNPVASHIDNGILYICLNGRIDASNAADVQKLVSDVYTAASGLPVIVDAEKLEYISSAGLRILLRLRKDEPKLAVINTSPEVYDVLDMTGFTEMMTVKKQYRQLSVEGCQIIGKGANGAVYRYDPETIVKVYFNPDALPDIQRERDLARKAFVLGINTAIPYDVVRIGSSYGTVMELLDAVPLSKLIRDDPDHLEVPLKYFVGMLRQIHATEVAPGEMPDMKQVAEDWAAFDRDYLPEKIGSKLCEMVHAIPVSHTMLHGDYHTNNIMIRDGEALLIDMDTLCVGHPVFEFGSMFNAFVGFLQLLPSDSTGLLGIPRELSEKFWQMVLAEYFETDDPQRLKEAEDKAKIIGYMRLLRRTIRRREPDREKQIDFYKNQLCDLVLSTDTLYF